MRPNRAVNNWSISTLLSTGPTLNNSCSVKYFPWYRYAKELPPAGRGSEGGVPAVLIWGMVTSVDFEGGSSLEEMPEPHLLSCMLYLLLERAELKLQCESAANAQLMAALPEQLWVTVGTRGGCKSAK